MGSDKKKHAPFYQIQRAKPRDGAGAFRQGNIYSKHNKKKGRYAIRRIVGIIRDNVAVGLC